MDDRAVTAADIDLQPCRRLASAILLRAIVDTHNAEAAIADQARAWLRSEDDLVLSLCCTLTGLDPAAVRARVGAQRTPPVYRAPLTGTRRPRRRPPPDPPADPAPPSTP